jgi:hypothetical protein
MMRWLPLLFVALLGTTYTILVESKITENTYKIKKFYYIYTYLIFSAAPAPELTIEFDENQIYTEDGKNVVTCNLCATIVEDVVIMLENGTVTDDQIINYIINTCARLNIFSNPDQVCGGMAAIALVRNKLNQFLSVSLLYYL